MKSIVEYISTGPSVRIGKFLLRELSDGNIWIENEIGEGMAAPKELVELCLKRFFEENF